MGAKGARQLPGGAASSANGATRQGLLPTTQGQLLETGPTLQCRSGGLAVQAGSWCRGLAAFHGPRPIDQRQRTLPPGHQDNHNPGSEPFMQVRPSHRPTPGQRSPPWRGATPRWEIRQAQDLNSARHRQPSRDVARRLIADEEKDWLPRLTGRARIRIRVWQCDSGEPGMESGELSNGEDTAAEISVKAAGLRHRSGPLMKMAREPQQC